MDLERNSTSSKSAILIRPFHSGDAPQVLKLYFTGLVNGVSSAGYFAITRAFLHWIPMFIAYLLLVAGGILFLSSQRNVRLLGLAAALLSLGFMLAVYYRIRTTFLGYYQDGLRNDMTDIARYYLNHEKGIRCFWVAEIPSATSESGYEVVGCVALDYLPKSDVGPMIGELRRMFVVPAYRKRGIGTKLIRTLITHAKEKGISSLKLETTNFQPIAREMYTRLGWYHYSTHCSDFEAGGIKMDFTEYRLSL